MEEEEKGVGGGARARTARNGGRHFYKTECDFTLHIFRIFSPAILLNKQTNKQTKKQTNKQTNKQTSKQQEQRTKPKKGKTNAKKKGTRRFDSFFFFGFFRGPFNSVYLGKTQCNNNDAKKVTKGVFRLLKTNLHQKPSTTRYDWIR